MECSEPERTHYFLRALTFTLTGILCVILSYRIVQWWHRNPRARCQRVLIVSLRMLFLLLLFIFYVNFKLKHVYWSNNAFNMAWPFGIGECRVYHRTPTSRLVSSPLCMWVSRFLVPPIQHERPTEEIDSGFILELVLRVPFFFFHILAPKMLVRALLWPG